jgi:NAD-dependent deacetylase
MSTETDKQIATLYRESSTPFDLVISIGTSSYFPYIVEPVFTAHRLGIATVEINPSETTVSDVVDVKIPLRAAESLEEIWRRYRQPS